MLAAVFACVIARPAMAKPDDKRVVVARKSAAEKYPPCMKPKPLAEDEERARNTHLTAMDVVKTDPKKAVELWTLAYGFDCSRPLVLDNLARAYGTANDPAMGIAVMELFVARAPAQDVDAAAVSKLTMEWRAALGTPTDMVDPDADPDWDKKKPDPKPDPGPKPTPTDGDMKRPFGPGPWIVFAVGGATMIGGAVALAIGRVNVGDAETQCGGHTNCTQDQIDLGNGGNTLTGVGAGLLAGGGAIAVAGLIWQFAGNKPVPAAGNEKPATGFMSPTVTFDPAFGPGLIGGTLRGAF